MEIDEKTGLPVLPDRLRWNVYTDSEGYVKVGIVRVFWGMPFNEYRGAYISGGGGYFVRAGSSGFTHESIKRTAGKVYIDYMSRQRHIKNRDLLGVYPPKSLKE